MIACYILLFIAGLILVVFIVGLCLPKERVVVCQTTLNAPPETVYNIVTDNDNWSYRSSIKELHIVDRNGGTEKWVETSADGATIDFATREKIPYSFYSFDMESKLFKGYWTADIKEIAGSKTLFTATEYIQVKNPVIKVLSYLFFDIKKLMADYQNDLMLEIEKRNSK